MKNLQKPLLQKWKLNNKTYETVLRFIKRRS